jgi:phosphoglycerate transporter family protein
MTTIAKAISRNVSQTFGKVLFSEKGSYTYWRTRMLYATIVGYSAFYLVRQNLAMAAPGISEEFSFTKTQIGLLATCFMIVYGIGKLINGYLSDRSDARYFMPIGLFLSAIVSLTTTLSTGIVFFIFMCGLNGIFQSMGWPACARLITHWFSPKELGTKWALWASSHQIGAVAIFGLGGFIIQHFGWRWVFITPALICMGLSFFLFNRLRDTPKEVGLPPVEEYKGDVHKVCSKFDERITLKEVWTTVLSNRLVWFMAFANMCLYIPRQGIFFWAPFFLKEYKGVTLIIAGVQLVGFEIASLIGGLVAGIASDKIFDGRRGPVGTICLIGVAISFFTLLKVPPGSPFLDAAILMAAGFFLNGSQVLNGVAVADFASKRAVGVATGFTGSFAYGGSALASGAAFGAVVEIYGWEWGISLFILPALVGAFFYALTWNHRAQVLEQSA